VSRRHIKNQEKVPSTITGVGTQGVIAVTPALFSERRPTTISSSERPIRRRTAALAFFPFRTCPQMRISYNHFFAVEGIRLTAHPPPFME